ncbi:MAG: hypothetical protein ABUK01_02015 [Leptospirales bacterium]
MTSENYDEKKISSLETQAKKLNDASTKNLLSNLFYNWGTCLMNLAKTKQGKEAEELYNQAIEKYQKAIEFGGSPYNLACLYAITGDEKNALHFLDISLKNKEISTDFVLEDEDWKNLLEHEKFKAIIQKYKT